jgi:hypothetical protein
MPDFLIPPPPRTRPLIPHPPDTSEICKNLLVRRVLKLNFIVHSSIIVPFKVLSSRPSNIRFQMTPSKRPRSQRRSNHPTTLSVWDSDVAIVLDPVDQKLMKDSIKGLKSGKYICGTNQHAILTKPFQIQTLRRNIPRSNYQSYQIVSSVT